MNDSNFSDINLLFEIGTLRRLKRQWGQFVDFPVANVAAHTFRVAWIAWIIATKESADAGKVIKMALIHDLGETRCGDRNYIQREYVQANEELAIREAVRDTALSEEIEALIRDLNSGISIEAKIVKDADSLDVDLELREMKAAGLSFASEMLPTREAALERLHTETAKSLFFLINKSNPDWWHIKARNRLNSGDWSK